MRVKCEQKHVCATQSKCKMARPWTALLDSFFFICLLLNVKGFVLLLSVCSFNVLCLFCPIICLSACALP